MYSIPRILLALALACLMLLPGFGGCSIAGVDFKVHVSPETQAEVLEEGEVAEVLFFFGAFDDEGSSGDETVYLRRIGVLCDAEADDAVFTKIHQWTGSTSQMTVTAFLVPSDRAHLECGDWGAAEHFQWSRELVEGARSVQGVVHEDDYEDDFAVLTLEL